MTRACARTALTRTALQARVERASHSHSGPRSQSPWCSGHGTALAVTSEGEVRELARQPVLRE